MKTVCVYNNKGGVAKTTSCVSIASTLCTMGKRCLMIDLDSQGCLGEVFLRDEKDWREFTIERILEYHLDVKASICLTSYKYYDRKTRTYPLMELDIIPASREFAEYEFSSVDELKNRLLPVSDDYDYCFIDMPPANADVTYVGLCASDFMILPFKADLFSASTIENVEDIYRKALSINPSLKFAGAFITDFDTRYKISDWIKSNYESGGIFFRSFVRHSSCFDEANLQGVPIVCLTGSKGAQDYLAVTEEFLSRIGE